MNYDFSNLTPTASAMGLDDHSHQSRYYQRYMKSPKWQRKRNAALRRAGYKCEECNITHGLQVHHLTYDRLGHEKPKDLQVLCEEHHIIADRQRAERTRKRTISWLIGW